MRTTWLWLVCAVTACSGKTESGSPEVDAASLKKAAAESVANGSAGSDPCAEHAWYGDSVCDTFCDQRDTDCVPLPAEPTVCAEFIEESDGRCARSASDPCIFQDPDCGQTVPGSPGGDDPVVCALYFEAADGRCSRESDDVCGFQDPDCDVVCPAIAPAPDGTCEERPNDPCWSDPDCASGEPGSGAGAGGTACAEFVEKADGVCSRLATDPCLFQDPDCAPNR